MNHAPVVQQSPVDAAIERWMGPTLWVYGVGSGGRAWIAAQLADFLLTTGMWPRQARELAREQRERQAKGIGGPVLTGRRLG